MSNETFPVLAGQTWPRVRSFRLPTTVHRANGRRYALGEQAYPTYAYQLGYSFLREADFAALGGFWLRHGGPLDSWLFDDRDDNTATAQTFGIGDGTTRTFQLVRMWGSYIEPVQAVVATPVIQVNGATVVPTVSSSGLVTFATAPAAAAALTWSGTYLWRCAFTKPDQGFEEFMRHLRTTKTVEFETTR